MNDTIEIVPYDPQWVTRFKEIGKLLRESLGTTAYRIDHIGSTAIPGLPAKPVIDIQVSVASFNPIDDYRLPIEQLGYLWSASNPELTKRYFRDHQPRTTHIHVRLTGSWSEQFALLFRDYLRHHLQDAARYGELKQQLAVQYRENRRQYVTAKETMIWEIIRRADRWAGATGYQPGPSDC